MRSTVFIIMLLLLVNIGYAQDINGKWVKVQAEMKDGSRILDPFEKDSAYSEYTISSSDLCINVSPVHKSNEFCIKYTRMGDVLKTSETSSFVIESISDDSLILYENINGLSDDKLKRIYFARKERIILLAKEKYKNKDYILATKFFTPTISKTLEADINQAFKGMYKNFDISGSLLFYPQEARVEVKIVYNSSEHNADQINIIQQIVQKSFVNWDLKDFSDYKTIELPFVLRSQISNRVKGVSILYFTQETENLDTMFGVKLQDINKSGQLFEEAAKAYSLKKYKKAIELFEEAYQVNPKNIDALYNVASLYHESGDKENACKTWERLSALGQTEGVNFYKKYCN